MRYLLVFVLLFGCAQAVFAAPKIAVEKLNYDFGEIFQGEKVQYVYRFRNAGDELLQIGNVKSSCGCTAALLSATRIAPGDIGELRLTFDSANFKGAIHKTVSIGTNDPLHSQVLFGLSGQVNVEVFVEPDRVNWGKVDSEEPLTSTVTVTNRARKTINLQPPITTSKSVSATLSRQTLAPGEQAELQITTKLPEGKKRLGGYVIIATDYPKTPQLRISVSARLAK